MLIVTRRVGETIVINDQIRVTIVATSDEKYSQIGIDAPKDVAITREELTRRRPKTRSR